MIEDTRFQSVDENSHLQGQAIDPQGQMGRLHTLTDTPDGKTTMQRLEPGPEGWYQGTGPQPTSTNFGPQQ